MAALHPKKQGSKLLLGENLDTKVQIYLRKVQEGGGAVSSRIVLAAARGTTFDMYIKILSSRYYSMNFYNYRYYSQIQPLSACAEWRASRVKEVLGSLPDEAEEVRSEKSYYFQVQVFIGCFQGEKGGVSGCCSQSHNYGRDPSRTCAELGPDWHKTSSKLSVDVGEARREAGGDGGHQRQMSDHCRLLWHYAGRIPPSTVNLPGEN